MQSTFYVPDEIEGMPVKDGGLEQRDCGRGRYREEASLSAHHAFATDVMQPKLGWLPTFDRPFQSFQRGSEAIRAGSTRGEAIWTNLLLFTKGRNWVWAVWCLEVFWMLFIVMAVTSELWGACPYALGLSSACQYCYSNAFLFWTAGFLMLWVLDLYLYVLLTSRGFEFHLKYANYIFENAERNVPLNAIYLFIYVSAIVAIWLVAGAVVLIMSEDCKGEEFHRTVNTHERSTLMVWTTILNIVFAPVLLFFGRCHDASLFCGERDYSVSKTPMYDEYRATM